MKPIAVWTLTPSVWPVPVSLKSDARRWDLLIITHHDKLLEHNPPQFTHVMLGGRIVETGGPELARELHAHGYDRIRRAHPDADAANRQMLKEESEPAPVG